MNVKNVLCVWFFCILIISVFCCTVYANEINSSYEVDLNKTDKIENEISYEEKNKLLNIEEFSVKSEIELAKENISLYRYSDLEGDYVSLREMIELIGGNVEWIGSLPENKNFNYGYININNKKYKFYYSAKEPYVISTKITFISMFEICTDGSEKLISVSEGAALTAKVRDNMLLIPADTIMCIFNRWGYIYTFDLSNKVFFVKPFDMIEENKKVKELLPKTHDDLYYDSEDMLFSTEVMGYDIFSSIDLINIGAYRTIHNHFDPMFKPYEIVTDYEARAKLCYKGWYYIDTDDNNITVEYNEKLDCYIAYNNKCSVDNPEFKMIAIRKFDGQIVYVYDV